MAKHYHMAPCVGRDIRTMELLRNVQGPETPPMTTRKQQLEWTNKHPTVDGGYMMFTCYYSVKLCKELHGERQTLR